MHLNGKRVLFIAPHFHQYHIEITKTLRLLGSEVTYFEEVFYSRVYTLARDKLFSPVNKILDELYFKKILKEIQKNEYDIFFLIRGGLIDTQFIQSIKESSPDTCFLMYQWDSLIHNNYEPKIDFFNHVYTFDKNDAKKLQIKYLPLFYIKDYADVQKVQDDFLFDICFFGTYHSDRLKIIKKIDLICAEKSLNFHYHLYAGKLNILLLILRKKIHLSDIKFFNNKLVTSKEIAKQYSISKAVLDIEMTNQTGLTIRTIEALGAGRKLLTTNINIKNSEIFDPNYVSVINRENPNIDIDFLNKPVTDYQRYSKFHISKWLDTIMGNRL